MTALFATSTNYLSIKQKLEHTLLIANLSKSDTAVSPEFQEIPGLKFKQDDIIATYDKLRDNISNDTLLRIPKIYYQFKRVADDILFIGYRYEYRSGEDKFIKLDRPIKYPQKLFLLLYYSKSDIIDVELFSQNLLFIPHPPLVLDEKLDGVFCFRGYDGYDKLLIANFASGHAEGVAIVVGEEQGKMEFQLRLYKRGYPIISQDIEDMNIIRKTTLFDQRGYISKIISWIDSDNEIVVQNFSGSVFNGYQYSLRGYHPRGKINAEKIFYIKKGVIEGKLPEPAKISSLIRNLYNISITDEVKNSLCVRNKQSDISCLTHQTDFKNIIQIMRSGYIKTGKELQEAEMKYFGYKTDNRWESTDQVNGVYMSVLTSNLMGEKWIDATARSISNLIYGEEVAFIFSTILLERDDYFLNLSDQSGYILSNTYSPFTLDKKKISEAAIMLVDFTKEIVFPSKVSLDWVEEIWIVGSSIHEYNRKLKAFQSLMMQAGKDIYDKFNPLIIPYSSTIPNKVYDKWCDNADKIKYLKENSLKPNYCNAYKTGKGRDEGYRVASLEIYQKIARNCGYTQEEINNKSGIELRNMISEVEIKRYKDPSIITPTIYYPPFK